MSAVAPGGERSDGCRCWICGSIDTMRWKDGTLERPVSSEDLRITDARYGVTLALRRCPDCGFIFAEDHDLERLDELYAQLSDPGYEESQRPRSLQMRWLVVSALRAVPGAATALDVGAGSGLLVREAERAGLDAVGIEPSLHLVETGIRDHGVDLLQGVLPHPALQDRRFDLVFLVDVIEHVARPVELLAACAGVLDAHGLLVVVTPDVSSLPARLLRRRWWHMRVAHVGYFNRSSLTLAARRAALEPVGWDRARWFFEVGYLADRVGAYLPVGALNRRIRRWGDVARLYDRVIRVNLYDSSVVFLRHRGCDPATR